MKKENKILLIVCIAILLIIGIFYLVCQIPRYLVLDELKEECILRNSEYIKSKSSFDMNYLICENNEGRFVLKCFHSLDCIRKNEWEQCNKWKHHVICN